MITRKNKSFSFEAFESVNEFLNTITNREPNGHLRAADSHYVGSSDWYGTESWEEAQELLKNGYKEGLNDLMKTASTVKVINPQHKSTFKAGVVGFAPIVPNALKGIPQAMITKKKVEHKQKTISILYDFGASCSVSNSTILRGGKNMYSLIQSLENKGYRVEFNLFNGVSINSKCSGACGITVKVKSYTQPLNPQLISYPIINTSFFRRHIFRWRETSPLYKGRDYGYTLRNTLSDIKGFLKEQGILKENVYYINVEEASKCKTIENMLQYLGIK